MLQVPGTYFFETYISKATGPLCESGRVPCSNLQNQLLSLFYENFFSPPDNPHTGGLLITVVRMKYVQCYHVLLFEDYLLITAKVCGLYLCGYTRG
jgi:hypothetical protein